MTAAPAATEASLADLARAAARLERAVQDFQAAARAAGLVDAANDTAAYQALRRWRSEQARARQLPPYVIASDAVLRAIDAARPATLEQLQAVRGIGPNKAALYGQDILRIIATASQAALQPTPATAAAPAVA